MKSNKQLPFTTDNHEFHISWDKSKATIVCKFKNEVEAFDNPIRLEEFKDIDSIRNNWLKWSLPLNRDMKAINLVNSGKIEEVKELGNYIVEAINTNNKELAQELLNKIEVITNIKTEVLNE